MKTEFDDVILTEQAFPIANRAGHVEPADDGELRPIVQQAGAAGRIGEAEAGILRRGVRGFDDVQERPTGSSD